MQRVRAQGATNTFWATMMLDSLVEQDTDVLIWEYAINDAALGSVLAVCRSLL